MTVQEIVAEVAETFPSFGQGSVATYNNPIATALAERPPMFAMGVDIEQVVRFVLNCKDD